LRDPRLINLRYETPWLDEYLMANLLADVHAGTLSPAVSQQEYSKLFERDRFGLASSTEYLSRGDWLQNAVQYGMFGNSSYAADVTYGSFNGNGHRPNNDLEFFTANLRAKQQLTPKDSIYFQGIFSQSESGDLAQYYDQANARASGRVRETQEPMVLLGYNHEWAPGIHTLALGGRLQDTLKVSDFAEPLIFHFRDTPDAPITYVSQPLVNPQQSPPISSLTYHSDFDLYTAELQQVFKIKSHTVVAGARYQNGTFDTTSTLDASSSTRLANPSGQFPILLSSPPTTDHSRGDLQRITFYGYET